MKCLEFDLHSKEEWKLFATEKNKNKKLVNANN